MLQRSSTKILDAIANPHMYTLRADKRDMIKTTGTLTYQGSWAILQCEMDPILYYQWFLRRKGVKVNLPIWKSHISVVRGEGVASAKWGTHEGGVFTYQYDPENIGWNGSYWWLEVSSPSLEALRVSMGLEPQPKYKLHWTIGKEYERRLGCRFPRSICW